MTFKIFILSEKVLTGDESVNISSFCKMLQSYGIDVEEIIFKSEINTFDLTKNSIFLIHDENIDAFVSKNKVFYETNSEIINNEAIICGNNVAFAVLPIESSFLLYKNVLDKLKERFDMKDILVFRLFGKTSDQIKAEVLKLDLKSSIKILGNGLLCDIYLEKIGKQGFISEDEVSISQAFAENIYTQSQMDMSEVIAKTMLFSKHNLFIQDSFTEGGLASKILKNDQTNRVVSETFIAKKDVNFLQAKGKCFRDESEMVYQMAAGSLESNCISIVVAGKKTDKGFNIFLAIGKSRKIDIFNFNIEGTKEDAIAVAENLALFNLIKKLREKDFEN